MSHSVGHNVHQNAMLGLIPPFPTRHPKAERKKKKRKKESKSKEIRQSRE